MKSKLIGTMLAAGLLTLGAVPGSVEAEETPTCSLTTVEELVECVIEWAQRITGPVVGECWGVGVRVKLDHEVTGTEFFAGGVIANNPDKRDFGSFALFGSDATGWTYDMSGYSAGCI